MKNYSLDSNEAASFILKYKVKDDEKQEKIIVIYMASGVVINLNYTASRERVVLKKMRQQIIDAKVCYKREQISIRKGYSLSLMAGIYAAFIKAIDVTNPVTTNVLCSFELGIVFYNFLKAIDSELKMISIDKNTLFINNMYLFESCNINEKVLSGLSRIGKRKLNRLKKVDINNVDRISYNDLAKLVENVKEYRTCEVSGKKLEKKQ